MPPDAAPTRRHRARLGAAAVALAAWAGTLAAQPAPRTVAVIDGTALAAGDPGVAALVDALDVQLDREAALLPVAPARRLALTGPVPDEDAGALAEARAALGRAGEAAAALDYPGAAAAADAGLAVAAGLAPGPAATRLQAELALARGLARTLDGDPRGGGGDFALVHRLEPGRALDPSQFFPEVVEAFAAAGVPPAATATLEITAPVGATAWVDGSAHGAVPAVVQVAPGVHVVTVTGEALVAAGRLLEVGADGARLAIDAAPADVARQLHRARRRLADATGAARADAAAAVVRLAGAEDALVVGRDAAGALAVEVFGGRTGALGEPRGVAGVPPEALVAPLRPVTVPVVAPPPVAPPPVAPPPVAPPPPWYRSRWLQASVGGGIVAGVLAAAVFVLVRDPGSSPASPMVVPR